YKCQEPGCDKSFTRADHLSRHRLNHSPSRILRCSFEGCDKTFVREDLLKRHEQRQRHRGSKKKAEAMMAELCFDPAPVSGSSPSGSARSVSTTGNLAPIFSNNRQTSVPSVSGVPIHSHAYPEKYNNTESRTLPSKFKFPNADAFNGDSVSQDLISWLFSNQSRVEFGNFTQDGHINLDSPMSIPNLISPPASPQDTLMTEVKRLDLMALIPSLGNDSNLSLQLMDHYIYHYWKDFHPQFPILHRPSFSSVDTPSPLLWAIILVGAALSGNSEIAEKIAEPLRWVIFRLPGFNPPAQLYVIQALLLLEAFEKTMGSRALHERAHVHHATTLMLLRRSSSMHESDASADTGPWNRWIQFESRKRTTFMAFILDVLHAILFTHGLILSVHELRLSMPCEESLWESYPYRDESMPKQKPVNISFRDAMKLALNNRPVSSGSLGKRSVLAGMIAFSLQMQLRDSEVKALGWSAFPDTWRAILTPAYITWKEDYSSHELDRIVHAVSKEGSASGIDLSGVQDIAGTLQLGCLGAEVYSGLFLLRMSMLDILAYAGLPFQHGRPVSATDFMQARKRVYEWATSRAGLEAYFYALQPLIETFIYPGVSGGYSAGRDTTLHRPFVLYTATVVVWAFGYINIGCESRVLEGVSDFESLHEDPIPLESGKSYLLRMSRAKTPDELMSYPNKHHTIGLLQLCRSSFEDSRWCLMKESRKHLNHIMERSMGR
ncbi:hypothetical protein CANCADRAFT_17618, partial [Tortispora caseinolytica NRRL Y-17796]